MAGGIDWFRWHHGSVTDPKFQLIARKSGASLPDVLAVWAYLLEQASANDTRGEYGSIDCEAVDCMFGFDDGRTAAILTAMEGREMLSSGCVTSWEKRQPKREDDTGADRKRRQREREHELRMAGVVTPQPSRHVTQCHAEVTQCHEEVTQCHAVSRSVTHGHDREEESREEEKREDIFSGKVVGAAFAARTEPAKSARLPDDWVLPKAWGDWARAEFPHWTPDAVRLEGQKFADHWRTKSGKDGRKADWQAAWRNWCRSDICQRAHPAGMPAKPRDSPLTFAERERQARSAEMAKWAPGIAARPDSTPAFTPVVTPLESLNVVAFEGR